ncbi:hypothetical protein DKG77_10735 [Flagellimonas aquimarina]|uniref:Uncharacterized protein n=1 Tax=Flagellimonas aquimarina TaxID=2201895 RepID=A0A316L153_9FLAO|nr:hypothetical protein [Allomuricauda koreensis]PWL38715.1 hypothetical protein DKG77_10735 [Allomuricauda koreensis]
MILTEKNIDEQKINQLVGPPFQQEWMKPKTIGSPGLFLKTFVNKSGSIENLKQDSKCNFEKRTEGLLLHTNYSNQRTLIALPFNDISELKITRGKEEIRTFFPYPMWILLKLGVSILYARYLRFRPWEYSIEPLEFKLASKNYDFEFIGNGFDFERKLDFLNSLGLDKILKKEIKAST